VRRGVKKIYTNYEKRMEMENLTEKKEYGGKSRIIVDKAN